MSWTVRYTRSAVRALKKLDPSVRKRVRAAIEALNQEPERGKPLQLYLKGFRSWRTGDFRIVYRIASEKIEILIVALGHRRDVYDRLRERLER